MEKDYAHHHDCRDGKETFVALHGESTSSTRPELLAMILAMMAPIPMHIAIDNNNVVRKAN
eukprot:2660519-Karenia_brevis.AAC.1